MLHQRKGAFGRSHLHGPTLVSKALERTPEEIHLEMTRMGGGFGRRLYGDFVLEAAEISDQIKKPVKVSREDDMTAGTYRPAIKYRIAASIKGGKITGTSQRGCRQQQYVWINFKFFPRDASLTTRRL